jgi:hypothetical protein
MSENPNIEKTYSEAILIEIRRIADRDGVSMFEACTTYAEEIDIEVEELVERLDGGAIAMLRQSAIEDNRVRQCVGVRTDALEFE